MNIDLNSAEFARILNTIIEQKVNQIVDQRMKKYGVMHGWSAIVSSVNSDGTANVYLAGDLTTNIIPNLKNKSNATLSVNDEVFLFSISSLTNAFIGIKK